MTKLLITNGCSLTVGTECAEPARQSWPAVVADQLGLPLVNLAGTGGSNRRMVRTTVSHLDRVCRETKVSPADVLFICMWTGVDRSEYHKGNRAGPWLSVDPRPDLPYERDWYRIGVWRSREDDGVKAYYRHLADDVHSTVNWLVDWLALDGFLRSRGVRARYTYAWHLFQIFKCIPDGEIQELVDLLDPDTIFGGQVWTEGHSFNDISAAAGFAYGPKGHPLAEAHANFGGLLANWLEAQDLVAS